MMYELSQKFFFDAAHTLSRSIDAAGSRRIHGHTYHAEVTLIGEPDPTSGMLQDLGTLRRHIETVREKLDHHFLDEVPELGPATLENLCRYIFYQLNPFIPGLVAVSVERQAGGDKCVLRNLQSAPLSSGASAVTARTSSKIDEYPVPAPTLTLDARTLEGVS